MGYVSLEEIVKCRSNVSKKLRKGDTFAGLIVFLLTVKNWLVQNRYAKADMKFFSEIVDDAFYLGDDGLNYQPKYWYAMFSNNWEEEAKNNFLKNEKISAYEFAVTLFWSKSFDSSADLVERLKSGLPETVFETFFYVDGKSNLLENTEVCKRSSLLKFYGGTQDAKTIKYDGSFVKKRAGDLSGAPFAQTLYAAADIKKIINISDFDFMSNFDLSNSSLKSPQSENQMKVIDKGEIKQAFISWLRSKNLKERTIEAYSVQAISYINKLLVKLNYKSNDLYDVRDHKDLTEVSQLFSSNDEWVVANEKGNNMYSAALSKYMDFLMNNGLLQASISTVVTPKSFLLLAGISGTGKTRFVREQADDDLSNYQLVSVRPDWHEPSDLLGYVTRLAQPEQYVATEVLVFIVKAWKEVVSCGFELSNKTASGDISNIENIRPFWLCLDEMNLAPVEQYFADYLSVSETRRWLNDGDELIYSCDTLLNPDLINSVDKDKLKKDLGLDDGEAISDKLWEHFCNNGISIPFNLIVAGTVNMDETTHGFSRKVIDRALSFDFGEFFPNIFSEFFEPTSSPKSLTYPIWSHADRDSLAATCDPDGERTIKFMEAINEKLDGTPFKLAYRALNEILLSVIANSPKTDQELLAVWDDFVMCKLLPRIEGDLDKLSSKEDNKSLLQVLSEALADNNMLGPIWDEHKDSPNARPDLYREKTEGDDKMIRIPCRSREKLDWMQARLERDTFTSFWP